MRDARAVARTVGSCAHPCRQGTESASQQLFRQARQFSGSGKTSRSRSSSVHRNKASGAGRGRRSAGGLTGAAHGPQNCGMDGCPSQPTRCPSQVWRLVLRGSPPASESALARRSRPADIPGGGHRAILRRRNRQDLHRPDDRSEGRGTDQDRRGRGFLRSIRRPWPRRCAEGRRWRDPSRGGDDRGRRRAASA